MKKATRKNPLLSDAFRTLYHLIEAEHVEPGIRQALEEAQSEVDRIAAERTAPTWANTVEPLDAAVERLTDRVTPAAHLVMVAETPALRAAYNAVLPDITAFWSRLPLNPALWRRLEAYEESDEARALTGLRRRHLDKTVRAFRRAGADLPADAKERLQALRVELAQLEQKFSENVLDATASYELHVTDGARLDGIPEAARRRARAKAEESGRDGWLVTLDWPSVEPILNHCADRELRREVHVAFATRCRDGGYDNRGLIAHVLRLRHELAQVLGFRDFPDYELEDRMAGTGTRAVEFERDLVERTRPFWEHDVAELRAHAAEMGLGALEPWDVAYVMEHLRKERYDIDDEVLRPYFPLPRVLNGMFEIVRRTFGFTMKERPIGEVWHEDVRFFEIYDEDGTMLGGFYTDWFPRKEKRQGAWMHNLLTGGPGADGFEPHLGVICGNFTPPEKGKPALLTHREVETMFHEFGHLLHHCTSKVAIPSRAGIHVAWDWVELPSQLMENWTWEREALDLLAAHYETGEPLPDDLYERMERARRFMGGWSQMRQLSLGTVDLDLHNDLAPRLWRSAEDAGGSRAGDAEVLPDGAEATAVMAFGEERFGAFAPGPRFAELHMLTSFTHLFSGGYEAGYYSYLWSEVLDADVFTRFKKEGIFNRETGRSYVDSILSRGDESDPDELFMEFMGRRPDPAALLERNLEAPAASEGP